MNPSAKTPKKSKNIKKAKRGRDFEQWTPIFSFLHNKNKNGFGFSEKKWVLKERVRRYSNSSVTNGLNENVSFVSNFLKGF